MRRQVPEIVAKGHGLLDAHHHGVGKAAQQHHDPEHDVHDADLLVIDAGEPLAPQVAPDAVVRQRRDKREAAERDDREGRQQDRLVVRNGLPCQAAKDQIGEFGTLGHRCHLGRSNLAKNVEKARETARYRNSRRPSSLMAVSAASMGMTSATLLAVQISVDGSNPARLRLRAMVSARHAWPSTQRFRMRS